MGIPSDSLQRHPALDNQSYTFNKTPDGRNGFGALSQTVFGDVRDLGIRVREELALTANLQLIAAIGYERSTIDALQTGYSYPVNARPVPDAVLHRYQLPAWPDDAVQIVVGNGGRKTRVYVHPQTLAVLKQVDEDDRLMRVIFWLRGELLLGNPALIWSNWPPHGRS